MEIKIWWTLVEVLAKKTNSFATLTRVFFSQTSTRVHQILIPTHNHEVTPYSDLYFILLDVYFLLVICICMSPPTDNILRVSFSLMLKGHGGKHCAKKNSNHHANLPLEIYSFTL